MNLINIWYIDDRPSNKVVTNQVFRSPWALTFHVCFFGRLGNKCTTGETCFSILSVHRTHHIQTTAQFHNSAIQINGVVCNRVSHHTYVFWSSRVWRWYASVPRERYTRLTYFVSVWKVYPNRCWNVSSFTIYSEKFYSLPKSIRKAFQPYRGLWWVYACVACNNKLVVFSETHPAHYSSYDMNTYRIPHNSRSRCGTTHRRPSSVSTWLTLPHHHPHDALSRTHTRAANPTNPLAHTCANALARIDFPTPSPPAAATATKVATSHGPAAQNNQTREHSNQVNTTTFSSTLSVCSQMNEGIQQYI